MKGFWAELGYRLRSYVTPERRKAAERKVEDALRKTEHGLELHYLDGPESEITSRLATATAQIIESLKSETSAAIRLGQLLIVKTTADNGRSNLRITSISPKLRRLLDSNPEMLVTPELLLWTVDKLANDSNTPD